MQNDKNNNKVDDQIEQEVQNLAQAIDQVEDEKLEIENKLKKALADYQNLERSIATRIDNRLVHLKKDLVGGIMESLDDLMFAQQAREGLQLSEDTASWADGILGITQKLEKSLAEIGVETIPVERGGEFNANLHEAVAVVDPEKGDTPGSIKEIIQKGYKIGEFILRPARVIVIKK